MSASQTARKGLMTVGALGALGLGGAALANAAADNTSTPGSAAQGSPPAHRQDPTRPGGHVGANGKTEAALPSDVAKKVEAAARAKVPGGTIERVETDVDHGSPYEAHVRKADGTELEVLVDSGFNVTAVNTMGHR